MHNSPIVQLFFNIALALYAFALVVFDNGQYLLLVYLTGGLLTAGFIVYSLLARVKPKFPPPLIAYTLLVALSVLSIFWSIDQEYSIGKARTLALILFNLLIVYNVIIRFSNVTWFFAGLYAAIMLNLLLALGIVDLGISQESLRFGRTTTRFSGTVNQSNLMGYITHITVFCAYLQILSIPTQRIKATRKMLEITGLLLVCAVCVFLTFITGSRTALVLLAMLVMWIIANSLFKPIVAAPLILVLAVGLFFAKGANINKLVLSGDVDLAKVVELVYNRMETGAQNEDNSRDERANLARAAYSMFKLNPMTGQGLGAFEYENQMYSHNNYLEIMSSVGLPGIILMLAFYILMLREVLLIGTWRMKLLMGLMVLSLMVYDLALVSFTAKFQMLTATILLASIYILHHNGERSVIPIDDEFEPQPKRRRRRRRRVAASAKG